MKMLWNVLSAGILLITLAILAIISIVTALIPLEWVLPLTIVVFGAWLIILAFIKKALKTTAYEAPPLMVGGWGILLIGIGMLWLYPIMWILIIAILILVVGLIAIIYSLMKKT
ncbi:MAG: hypothetical protein H3Z52_07000 [archaeon]|nr:hypothetical protein [archaeon]MCP8320671.1 hypothetical protein [archaeon]